MAAETLTASDVQDPEIRKELEAALKSKTLSFDAIKKIVAVAISKGDDAASPQMMNSAEYNDLMTLVERSTTITDQGRKHIRDAILVNYTQHMLKVGSLKTAVQKLLSDQKLSLSDINEIINEALADKTLSDAEISDLLQLRKDISDPIQRMFLFSVITWTITAKAPPATPVTATSPIRVGQERSDPQGKYFFEIHVLQDKANNPEVATGAHTRITLSRTDGKWETSGGTVTIQEWPRITKLEIQTSYSASFSATSSSGYGRGTTDADILAKNISLGFHESKHREEAILYIQTAKIPEFTGTSATMEASAFTKKLNEFKTSFTTLNTQMMEQNDTLVDEVGYKLSQYKKDNKSDQQGKMMKQIKQFGWTS